MSITDGWEESSCCARERHLILMVNYTVKEHQEQCHLRVILSMRGPKLVNSQIWNLDQVLLLVALFKKVSESSYRNFART